MSHNPTHKNPHLQRQVQITETQHELMNSRLHPKTKKKLNGKIGGLKKGLPSTPKGK